MSGRSALACAIGLNVLYLVLCLAILLHAVAERRAQQSHGLLAFTLWWPFYGDLYDGSKQLKRLRMLGCIVLLAAASAYVAAFASSEV
jgi:uncharacterized membrane protein